jgi:hypothetical protein
MFPYILILCIRSPTPSLGYLPSPQSVSLVNNRLTSDR